VISAPRTYVYGERKRARYATREYAIATLRIKIRIRNKLFRNSLKFVNCFGKYIVEFTCLETFDFLVDGDPGPGAASS
jgi:hypothetical protein